MRRSCIILAALAILSVSCHPADSPSEPSTLTVSPTTLSFGAEDASSQLVYVTTDAAWTVSASESWIHLDKSSGSGKASLTVTVDANTGSDRSGTLTFSGAKETFVTVEQQGVDFEILTASPAAYDGVKRASTTYQLLIYSFADSDGDGIGDFRGIISKLDYLDAMGVSALWLSPAHPTPSYHAYDVNDYTTVNPLYGTEDDFKALIDAAHTRGIKIYMDYVLNHSGTGTTWYRSALSDPDSPYRDYYVFSDNPSSDVAAGKVDNFAGAKNPGMGDWHSVSYGEKGYSGRLHFKLDWTGSTKTVTVTETTDAAQASNDAASKWIYYGNGTLAGLYETATGIFEITVDFASDWGFLVRTSTTTWDGGTKYGGSGGAITFGTPFTLDNATAADILFGGQTSYYFASFSASMPDLNYGPYARASESGAFQEIAASADKWIGLGIDGFRLDAVVWIYQQQVGANQSFLRQWYDRCNASFKAAGHTDDIFMVGEAWEGHSTEKQYYKGIPSCFEFEYFGALTRAVGGSASDYVSTVNGYIADHAAIRSDAVTSIFMTNHDQNRAAESFGKDLSKEKLAAAMLLTTPGKPFIYQGEELGYYGKKDGGDEYVRTPILWDKAGKDCAKKGVNNKVDNVMLTAIGSVEAQAEDDGSLLSVYRTFGQLRSIYPALAEGTMTVAPWGSARVAAWYMTASDGQKMLVVHNVASSRQSVTVTDDLSHPVAILGSAGRDHDALVLEARSSAVFLL